MKKTLLLTILAFAPVALLAQAEGVESDILQRSVNFVIFAAILWYLLADKMKAYFAGRTLDIQSELDKVQDTLNASQAKFDEVKIQLDDAKIMAAEIVESAKSDIDSVKTKVLTAVDLEIANLSKNFDAKIEVETRKAKKEIVNEILNELLNSDNLTMSEEELVNIVIKKVA